MLLLLIGTMGYGIYSLGILNQQISDTIAGPAARLEKAQELGNIQLRLTRSQTTSPSRKLRLMSRSTLKPAIAT